MSQPPCQPCAHLSLAGSALPSYASWRCAFRARLWTALAFGRTSWFDANEPASTCGSARQETLATGFGITAIAGTVDGKENAHRQAKSGAGALPVSTLQPRSQVLVYNLTRCTIQGILVPRPDIVHLTGRNMLRAQLM